MQFCGTKELKLWFRLSSVRMKTTSHISALVTWYITKGNLYSARNTYYNRNLYYNRRLYYNRNLYYNGNLYYNRILYYNKDLYYNRNIYYNKYVFYNRSLNYDRNLYYNRQGSKRGCSQIRKITTVLQEKRGEEVAQTCKKRVPRFLQNQSYFRFSTKYVWFSAKLWAMHVQNTNNIGNIM